MNKLSTQTSCKGTSNFTNPYSHSFRRLVHKVLFSGYTSIKAIIRESDEEDVITDRLILSMRNILRSNILPGTKYLTVHEQRLIPGGGREGNDRRKTDFIFEKTGNIRYEYVFEAKLQNYRKAWQKASHYVREEGMKRFLAGEYADYTATHSEVGMIGYVLNPSVHNCQKELIAEINRRKTELGLVGETQKVNVIPEFPYEWKTEHKRSSSNQNVVIYHTLLDFT